MKKAHQRRLFHIFAFALLAFAIYLVRFYKEAPTPNGAIATERSH